MNKLLTLALCLLPATVVAATDTFVCEYPKYSDKSGNQKVKDKFSLTFVVDRPKGTAYIIGNQGSAQVKMIARENGMAFIEITDSGNVMTTAITSNGESVHSRNTVIIDSIVASQYYGRCVQK